MTLKMYAYGNIITDMSYKKPIEQAEMFTPRCFLHVRFKSKQQMGIPVATSIPNGPKTQVVRTPKKTRKTSIQLSPETKTAAFPQSSADRMVCYGLLVETGFSVKLQIVFFSYLPSVHHCRISSFRRRTIKIEHSQSSEDPSKNMGCTSYWCTG